MKLKISDALTIAVFMAQSARIRIAFLVKDREQLNVMVKEEKIPVNPPVTIDFSITRNQIEFHSGGTIDFFYPDQEQATRGKQFHACFISSLIGSAVSDSLRFGTRLGPCPLALKHNGEI